MFKEACLALTLGLSPAQSAVVNDGYNKGAPHDLGYSLAAMVIVESSAGKYKFNPKSLDIGNYQINLKTAMSREEVTTFWGFLSLTTNLMWNSDFNAEMAIKELQYWENYYSSNVYRGKDKWIKVWSSYNAGWRHTNGYAYSQKIKYTVRQLHKCEDVNLKK